MKISILLFLFLISVPVLSQNKSSDTVRKIPFDNSKIKNETFLSPTSDVFRYDSLYIWNDRRNLSEVMDMRSGYFVNNFGLGERNVINFNSYSEKDIGIFRDGIEMNDFLFGGFDVENISVNEIEKIEEVSNVSSFLYGLYSTGKAINVITKDYFRPQPFSQLRYSQDRFNALSADVAFTIPLSRKVNIMLGGTKQSLDGFYNNSEFDVWRGRTRLSFYPSPNLNVKINFYYNKIKRGLNGGLIINSNEDSLMSATAPVVNPHNDEELENYYYDISLTSRLFKNKESLTKLRLYSINSTRSFATPGDSATNLNQFLTHSEKFHYTQYCANLVQNVYVKLGKKMFADFIFDGNVYLNYYGNLYDNTLRYILNGKIDFYFYNAMISVFGNNQNRSGGFDFEFNKGTEAKVNFTPAKDIDVKLFGGINQTVNNENTFFSSLTYLKKIYYEFGTEISLWKNLSLKGYYYKSQSDENVNFVHPEINYNFSGISSVLSLRSKYVNADIAHNYAESGFFPQHYFKGDISFHDILFRNKLNLHTGFVSRFMINQNSDYTYDQSIYTFFKQVPLYKENRFYLDFYIGARIGRANVNLTLANILDSFYYDTHMFPYDNRGGFLNSISRFTIVWDFLN